MFPRNASVGKTFHILPTLRILLLFRFDAFGDRRTARLSRSRKSFLSPRVTLFIRLFQSEKGRKTTELELHDSEQRLTEATSLAHRAVAERKKYEADAMQYHSEVADVRQELKSVDERVTLLRSRVECRLVFLQARKLAGELILRDEEIRHEREKTSEAEASKRALEQQLRDCSAKIDEAEAYARAEGKRIAAKYEGRVSGSNSSFVMFFFFCEVISIGNGNRLGTCSLPRIAEGFASQ